MERRFSSGSPSPPSREERAGERRAVLITTKVANTIEI